MNNDPHRCLPHRHQVRRRQRILFITVPPVVIHVHGIFPSSQWQCRLFRAIQWLDCRSSSPPIRSPPSRLLLYRQRASQRDHPHMSQVVPSVEGFKVSKIDEDENDISAREKRQPIVPKELTRMVLLLQHHQREMIGVALLKQFTS